MEKALSLSLGAKAPDVVTGGGDLEQGSCNSLQMTAGILEQLKLKGTSGDHLMQG